MAETVKNQKVKCRRFPVMFNEGSVSKQNFEYTYKVHA